MATYFFPSCKLTAGSPDASARLRAYLAGRWGATPVGCCRTDRTRLTAQDTALVACTNCAAILQETSLAGRVQFAWERMDQDATFPFPDYGGEAMAVQDCWTAVDNPPLMDAVRSLLRKMRLEVVELPENRGQTRYCGVKLTSPCQADNARLAPRRYGERGAGLFTPLPPDAQAAYFKDYCRRIPTARAACYCGSCKAGLDLGGVAGVHLLDLLFPSPSPTTKEV